MCCSFLFPKARDIVSSTICKEWKLRCRRADKFNVETSSICADHFTSNDYERDLKSELLGLPLKKILKKNAVPTVNLGGTLKVATEQTAREKRAAKKKKKELLGSLKNRDKRSVKNRCYSKTNENGSAASLSDTESSPRPPSHENMTPTGTSPKKSEIIQENGENERCNSSTTESPSGDFKGPKLVPLSVLLEPSLVPKSATPVKNFQDAFQKKVRHQILSDIARERMQGSINKNTNSTEHLKETPLKNKKIKSLKSTPNIQEYKKSTRVLRKRTPKPAEDPPQHSKSPREFQEKSSKSEDFRATARAMAKNQLEPSIPVPPLQKISQTATPKQGLSTYQTLANSLTLTANQALTVNQSLAGNQHIVFIPQTPGTSNGGIFLLPQNIGPQIIVPQGVIPPLQLAGQIPFSPGLVPLTTDPKPIFNSGVQKHGSLNTSNLSNSSTDTASENGNFNQVTTYNDISTIDSLTFDERCRTCLNPVPNSLDRAPISMECFEENTVMKALLQLTPQMDLTLKTEHFVCQKCFLTLRNTLKFMKRCQEVENMIAKEQNKSELKCSHIDTNAHVITSDVEVESEPEENHVDKISEKEGDDDSEFEYDPNVEEEDYIVDSITKLTKTSETNQSKNDLEGCVINHLNFRSLEHAEIPYHDSIITLDGLSPDFLLSLQKNKIRLLQNCKKFDENIFDNKRVLLIGGHTEMKCLLCEEHFNTETSMQDHIEDVHELSKAFLMETYRYQYKPDSSSVCEACDKDCGSVANKKIHLKNCYVFPCPYCDELFSWNKLPQHTQGKHKDPKPFKCFRCRQEKSSFLKFKSHLCHPCTCGVCGKEFLDKRGLQAHKSVCNDEDRTMKCSECGERIDASDYQTHLQTHQYQCSICSKIFHQRVALNTHEYRHRKKKKGVLCPICGKFVRNGLRAHMEVHEENRTRSFKCDLCPKSFFSKTDMKKHDYLCHKVPRSKCEECGIICKESNLEKHYRMTPLTGINPKRIEVGKGKKGIEIGSKRRREKTNQVNPNFLKKEGEDKSVDLGAETLKFGLCVQVKQDVKKMIFKIT
ncbi:hypothetical protein JTB14_011091 [Gonioctena quinquepunctata]|nr:hypothetical protein JTB14_011091 [Gonioctena quinquepunctata]